MKRDGENSMPPLEIKLFGAMEVQVNGVPLPPLRSRKELWLLALLALQNGRPVKRARLAQELWPFPDHAVDQAAYNLRRGLTNLRKALGTEAYRLQSPTLDTLRLNIENANVDIAEWEVARQLKDVVSLETALACYAGPLLRECTELWAVQQRADKEQQYLQVLQARSESAGSAGDWETVDRCSRRVVEIDPFCESAQRGLMRGLAQGGNHYAALQAYQEFSLRLHRIRNTLPEPETTTLYEKLRAELRDRPRARTETKEATSEMPNAEGEAKANPPLRRLPVPLTALIGRAQELEAIRSRFQQARLLTLTGAGGIGKTRLAIQLAEELSAGFRDGVCFVDMSTLTDGEQIAQMAVAALNSRETSQSSPLQTLLDFLSDKHLLLLLDNCEHLVDTCAALAETLLQHCRYLQILATSRQPLDVQGESVWRVSSLSLPDAKQLPGDNAALTNLLQTYAAIQLFVERACLARSDFVLTPQNAPAVLQICQQLDGIPLALELAAARVKALPVEQIAIRLDDRFRLLTNGPRTALSRQRTLEAAIKWSFDLLSEEDRAMLSALSVFVGGWTLEAAEAVCEGTEGRKGEKEKRRKGDTIANRQSTMDGLTRLVDRSLVIYEQEGGQARYRLLETVRQYSREELADERGAQSGRERHLDYFLHLVEEASPHLQGKQQAQWLTRLETEHDNLRAALEWSLTQPTASERGLQMASLLWRFWHKRGYLSLGRQMLANALERTPAVGNTAIRAEALNGAGMLACLQGDHAAANTYFQASLAIGNERDDAMLQANALHSLGQMAWNRHDYPQARRYFANALALHREFSEPAQVAITLNYLGVVASDEGDHGAARQCFEEGLAIGTELNDMNLIASSLHGLAHRAFYCKDYPEARRFYSEELTLARRLHDRELTAKTLHRLACVEHDLQNYPAARMLFEESLTLARKLSYRDLLSAVLYSLGKTAAAQEDYAFARDCFAERLAISVQAGDRPGLFYTLDAVAAMLAAQGQAFRAVTLFSVAQTLRESLLMPPPPDIVSETPRLQSARAALGEAQFAQAWEKGRLLSLEEAIDQAVQ